MSNLGVGSRVMVKGHKLFGTIIEDRGGLGPGGCQVWRVRLDGGLSSGVELLDDQLEAGGTNGLKYRTVAYFVTSTYNCPEKAPAMRSQPFDTYGEASNFLDEVKALGICGGYAGACGGMIEVKVPGQGWVSCDDEEDALNVVDNARHHALMTQDY